MSTRRDLKLAFVRKCNPAAVGEPLCQYPREDSRGYHGKLQFRQGEKGLMSDEECEHQASRNARLRSSLYGGRSLHNHDGLPMSSVLAQL